jgi:hypothetical protein
MVFFAMKVIFIFLFFIGRFYEIKEIETPFKEYLQSPRKSSRPIFAATIFAAPTTPDDKKREPSETKFSIIKHFKGIKPCYGTDINTYTRMGGPPLFLSVLGQPFGLEATPVSTSALLLFQCAVKLLLLNLILS